MAEWVSAMVVAGGAFVGVGIWVGKIQQRVQHLEDDVARKGRWSPRTKKPSR